MQFQRSAWRASMLLLSTAAYARAQATAAASLGTLMQRAPGAPWQSTSALWQSAQIDTRWTQFASDGLLVGSGRGSMQLQNVAFLGSFSPAPLGPVRWLNAAELNGTRDVLGDTRTERSVESTISFAALGGGAWLGGGAEQGRAIDGRAAKPLLLFGMWRPFGRATFSLTSSSRRAHLTASSSRPAVIGVLDSVFNDTTGHWDVYTRDKAIGDSSGTSSRDVRWTEVEARVGWTSNRWALDARLGVRPRVNGLAPSSWARVTTTFALASRLSLVAAAGNETALSSTQGPRTPFISVGLRVAPAALARPRPPVHVRPAASEFRLLPVDAGRFRVIVHATSARTLELSGDFDGWRPVSLVQTAPDEWETTLSLVPGTYRVNVRVNGDRWTAPPGLPTAEDEFNGTVGLLVVR